MNSRLLFPNIEGTEVLFTDEFQEYLLSLHDLLSDRILENPIANTDPEIIG